jgi:hypothetical protein
VLGDAGAGLPAYVQAHFESDGQFGSSTSFFVGSITYYPTEWWTSEPQANVGNFYQIRATLPSGLQGFMSYTGAPALNTWHTMSSNLIFRLERFSGSPFAFTPVLFEIRDIATLTIQDSFTMNFTVGTLVGPSFP